MPKTDDLNLTATWGRKIWFWIWFYINILVHTLYPVLTHIQNSWYEFWRTRLIRFIWKIQIVLQRFPCNYCFVLVSLHLPVLCRIVELQTCLIKIIIFRSKTEWWLVNCVIKIKTAGNNDWNLLRKHSFQGSRPFHPG